MSRAQPYQEPPSPPSPFDHVFLVIEENRDYVDIVGSANAPYINNTLIAGGTLLSNYSDDTSATVSLPNYLQIGAGSDFSVTDDLNPPSNHVQVLATKCLADLIEAAGRKWRVYADGYLGGAGTTTITDGDSAPYVEHHLPWVYFNSIRTMPYRSLNVQDLTNFSTSADFSTTSLATTPHFAHIVPNNNNNMHDGTVATGDAYLQNTVVPMLTGSKAWTSKRCLLIVVWDETLHGVNGEKVPVIFYASQNAVKANLTVATAYNHLNLCKTIEWALGLGSTANGESASARIAEPFR